MDRAVSIIMGLCCVLLSLHTSPASIMLPLLSQHLMLPMLLHAYCGDSRRADCNTSAYPELLLADCSSSSRGNQQLCTGLLRSWLLSLSFCLSLALSFSFFLTRTFMTAPANKTNTPTATSCSATGASISSNYRHADTYWQSHTHTHVINMENGRAAARSIKGQNTSRAQ